MFTLPFPELEGLAKVGASIILVLVAMGISRWRKANLERDILLATVRGFVQLLAIGYALTFIFDLDSPIWTTTLLIIMTTVAGRTAGQRGKRVPNANWIGLLSVLIGTFLTLGTLVALRIFTYNPQTIIPIGGMVLGNAMTAAALVMNRLEVDFHGERKVIESALALGATSQQAAQPQFRKALQSAMIPIVDTTKTVGLIKLPGAMTGMILAGASPIEAVQIQMIVMYMLLGANTFTGLVTAFLTHRQFFTPIHQLVLQDV